MVKLTLDLIARQTSGYTKKKRDESIQHYLSRLTHLYLEDKNIDEIGEDLSNCPHLAVLYLYNNKLTKIPNLNQNLLLTHLYLQNNSITKLENLSSIRKLKKLFIGANAIAVVEGLENLTDLQELHVENQRLGLGEKLLFDLRSIRAIAKCLSVLNVSGNRLTTLTNLQCLSQLTQLFAADNQLTDLAEMAQLTSSWRCLTRIDLSNNPICQCTRYRDRIIVVAPRIEVFDGKEVTETVKRFLKSWQANKEAVKQKVLTRQSAPNLHTRSRSDAKALQQPGQLGYIVPALPHARHLTKILRRSNSQIPNVVSSEMLARDNSLRIYSGAPDSSHYLNTYSTYYHAVRPKPSYSHSAKPKASYSVSLVTFDPNYKNDVNATS